MSSPHRNARTAHSQWPSSNDPSRRAQSADRFSRSRSQNDSPRRQPPAQQDTEQSTASFLAYPVSRVASSLYRRLTEDLGTHRRQTSLSSLPSNIQIPNGNRNGSSNNNYNSNGSLYVPMRTASPFAPPPLTGLTLRGHRSPKQQILSRGLAEEIRLLLPPRLQLATEWSLAYSIETDGVSLGTLYERCAVYAGEGHGFVLVIKDSSGSTFGAYLTDPPHPSPHYFGTGECFLWRATILPASSWMSNLPPPPSADTSNLQRSTTILANATSKQLDRDMLSPWGATETGSERASSTSRRSRSPSPHSLAAKAKEKAETTNGSGSTEDLSDRIRFKAFPYSGVNDYMIFCEAGFVSVGGGDGHYGLWLDSSLEHGVSSTCLTFGNEPLSEDGEKFDILGVEIWWVAH